MKSELLEKQAALEQEHWWFVARRRILDRVVAGLDLPSGARILEAGCGTGGNLPMLARHGEVFAFDVSETARHHAAASGCAQVVLGELPRQIPFPEVGFDLIVLLDVLEHVENDGAVLRALKSRLKPGGRLLITVPALPSLWSYHDEQHHHFRRYRKAELTTRVLEGGYELTTVSYFNTLLFPLVRVVRFVRRLAGEAPSDDLDLPRTWVNSLLTKVFAAERHLVGNISLPIGVSLLAVARV